MTNLKPLSCATFNCRSLKSSMFEVRKLCNSNDIVLLQEHWLLPHELGCLNNVHHDFLSKGYSAVDVSQDILIGRPYGGTAILYRRDLAGSIKIIETYDDRLTAVELLTNVGSVLVMSVYMPTDCGDSDCLEKFTDVCARIVAIYAESAAVHLVVGGDYNCQPGTRFYTSLMHVLNENKFLISDVMRLSNVVTYFSDTGNCSTTWIDHFVCSQVIDKYVSVVDVLYDFITSDHKPMLVQFAGIHAVTKTSDSVSTPGQSIVVDWSKADAAALELYQKYVDCALQDISLPVELLADDVSYVTNYPLLIDAYYSAVMNTVSHCTFNCIPAKQVGSASGDVDVVPGWNDVVKEKHALARSAFLEWVYAGKPRAGIEFMIMNKTRASFKLALRYCKQHDEFLRADACASSLTNKDYRKFWNCIRKSTNDTATKFAHTVNGVTGEAEITEAWANHFDKLYNSVTDGGARARFYDRLKAHTISNMHCDISVSDILSELSKQKKGKAVGADGIAMEAFIFGGVRLAVHICFLFRLFIKYGYMPKPCMASVIVPLVKCKSGDLSDINNYRAIALSTTVSKLFESAISRFLVSNEAYDAHQFGFKRGHSTSLCTSLLKRTVDYYTDRGSHVFACFIDFTKAFDHVNYWKLFNKLLDDHIDGNIVGILAYWYSHQEICVRWHNTLSKWFTMGNGTRQGGVLSPGLFSRYIRDLLSALVTTHVGCNVGGIFYNVLAYADDLVLLAPSWTALQRLLNVFSVHIDEIDMTCNVKKTVCMVFPPKNRTKIISTDFPKLHIGSCLIEFVHDFKYLGHIVTCSLADDDDIMREVRNLFIRTNILIRRFSKCSHEVKIQLFKSYCICLYDTALWKYFTSSCLNKLRSAYNKCIKLFFGYRRCYSVTQMLMELGLPSFNTILVNGIAVFSKLQMNCANTLVGHMRSLQL